jgi:hypothetical protein
MFVGTLPWKQRLLHRLRPLGLRSSYTISGRRANKGLHQICLSLRVLFDHGALLRPHFLCPFIVAISSSEQVAEAIVMVHHLHTIRRGSRNRHRQLCAVPANLRVLGPQHEGALLESEGSAIYRLLSRL